MYSATYPFNSQLIRIIFRNLSKTRDTDNTGYMPLYGKMKNIKEDNTSNETTSIIDQNKTNALIDIATYCRQHNINLVFVCSPAFINQKEIFGYKTIKEITESEQCRFLDFSNDSVFKNHPEYFEDKLHLNNDGAKIFSSILSADIYNHQNNNTFGSIPDPVN